MDNHVQNRSDELASDVLIVEDDFALSFVMSQLLKYQGHLVRVAHTGLEVKKQMAAKQPDAILLDISLPDTDGFEIVKQIRSDERYASMCLVVHTSRDLTRDERRRLTDDGVHIITKSMATSDELSQLLREYLPACSTNAARSLV